MDFFLENNSGLPAYAQINEQVKLGLLVGTLRPGDTLPSIRDVAAQLGVNRGVVYKAYMQLHEAGILDLRHGKGVLVEKELKYNHQGINERSEVYAHDVLAKLRASGICPSSFARYLYQKAREVESKLPFVVFVDITKPQAVERANRISSIWHVRVEGISFEELSGMEPKRLKQIQKFLVSYLRVDQVRKLLRKTSANIIPIGIKIKHATLMEFKKFPSGVSVLLVMDDRDRPIAPFLVELYKREYLPPSINVVPGPFGKIGSLKALVNSTKYHRLIFATSIWEKLPEDIKKHPRATHPQIDLDLASIESARISAGVIV
jgi:DNA-binding transcriptional regulator YhcF (GntR family)